MGRRSDHSREELRELALRAAEKVVERDGLRELSARQVARKIGYAVGTLYNLFEDFDDLVIQVNARTLDALHQDLTQELERARGQGAVLALALRYSIFVVNHSKRWNALFEHSLPAGRELPPWYQEKIQRLLGILAAALAPYFPSGREAQRDQAAQLLWASVHGICSLASADKLPSQGQTATMVRDLVETYLRGLDGAAPRGPRRLRAPVPQAIVPPSK